MEFLKLLFGRLGSWLQSLGVGALGALLLYFQMAPPDQSGDPFVSMVSGLILTGIVKLVGALVAKFGPKPNPV